MSKAEPGVAGHTLSSDSSGTPDGGAKVEALLMVVNCDYRTLVR
ncbi:MAG: hypothetical protein ACRERX_10330 [Pseudomonas sp.]